MATYQCFIVFNRALAIMNYFQSDKICNIKYCKFCVIENSYLTDVEYTATVYLKKTIIVINPNQIANVIHTIYELYPGSNHNPIRKIIFIDYELYYINYYE